jgi:riboflavin-specific deaminase-like protein
VQRPWISTNLAISADGKISAVSRRPSGWTSADDHQRLRELRRGADALMVGRGTLTADQMTLTVSNDALNSGPPPLRCVVSRTGVIPPGHPLFTKPGGAIHLLITGPPEVALPELPAGVTVHRQNLAGFLATLATELGVARLHCEGGGELIASLAALDAIDEFHLTVAGHTVFGGRLAPTATGIPSEFLPASLGFELTHFEPRADLGECFLSYRRLQAQTF